MNISSEDLIFYKDGKNIYSGGFNVNSVLLKKGHSPFISFNSNNHNNKQKGGSDLENEEEEENINSNNVSDLFKNFVVPSGLLYYPNKDTYDYKNESYRETDNLDATNSEDEFEYISDDLHERLLNLASKYNEKLSKGGSKKRRKNKNKSTKKSRKF